MNPILRLLEAFVLDRIGELEPEAEAEARRLMKRAFGSSARWQSRLQRELGVTEAVNDQLRAMWKRAKAVAAEKGLTIEPAEFARMVVDENFAEAAEMVAAERDPE